MSTNHFTALHGFNVAFSTFLLAWGILPMQMEYHASGHFSTKEKVVLPLLPR